MLCNTEYFCHAFIHSALMPYIYYHSTLPDQSKGRKVRLWLQRAQISSKRWNIIDCKLYSIFNYRFFTSISLRIPPPLSSVKIQQNIDLRENSVSSILARINRLLKAHFIGKIKQILVKHKSGSYSILERPKFAWKSRIVTVSWRVPRLGKRHGGKHFF